MTLSEDQFLQEVNYSQGSLHNQLAHMAGVDGRWLRGGRRAFKPLPEEYATRGAARGLWNGVSQESREYCSTLEEGLLAQKPQGMNEPTWQILAHLVNHGTHQRAQILRQLHDWGAPTFPQNSLFYLWEKGAR